MTTTRLQILGWLEHCEREHPNKGTMIPTWLATMSAVNDAVESGHVKEIGRQPFISREGSFFIIYGLTDKGRAELYGISPPVDLERAS